MTLAIEHSEINIVRELILRNVNVEKHHLFTFIESFDPTIEMLDLIGKRYYGKENKKYETDSEDSEDSDLASDFIINDLNLLNLEDEEEDELSDFHKFMEHEQKLMEEDDEDDEENEEDEEDEDDEDDEDDDLFLDKMSVDYEKECET